MSEREVVRPAPASSSSSSSSAPSFDALRRELAERAPWPNAEAEPRVLETHISLLFFVGERVYKLKKPVDLGFLDYTTLERRKHFCEEELRLNRRLAPDVYVGVVPVVRDEAGELHVEGDVEGDGEVVDWMVAMRRLPDERMFDKMLERGVIDNALLADVARLLARFHADARTGAGVDEHATRDAVLANVEENFEQTARFVAPEGLLAEPPPTRAVVSQRLHAFLHERMRAFLDEHAELFERRLRAGRAREGHGDLHSGNVCFTREGPLAYDCIEFNERFRCGDVAGDLAFLAMDLDLRGFRAFSSFLVREYAREAGDADLHEVLDFYKSYRAHVRAKVACFRSADERRDPEEREDARLEAMRYYHLCATYHLRPALVLTCGLPGSGKTWAARQVAAATQAVLLRSDVTRRQLAGLPLRAEGEEEELDQGLYSEAMNRRTFGTMLEDAHAQLAHGRWVVVDATFSKIALREGFREVARELDAPFLVVHVRCRQEEIEHRMLERSRRPGRVTDANLRVYYAVKSRFEPPGELPPEERVEYRSGNAPERLVAQVVDRLVELHAGSRASGAGSGRARDAAGC